VDDVWTSGGPTGADLAPGALHDTLAHVVDGLPSPVLLVGGLGAIVYANARAAEWTGRSGSDLAGRAVGEVIPGWGPNRVIAPRTSPEGGWTTPSARRWVLRHVDGADRTVLIDELPLPAGTATALVLRDLHSDHLGQPPTPEPAQDPNPDTESAQLRQTQRDIRAILDNLPAMIGYWDADLRNRMGNQAYVEWFGFTPQDMYGRHIREVLGERLFELNLPYMTAALRGEAQLFDRTIIDTQGVTRHTQASYIPDTDTVDGAVRGFFVLVTDITARKNAEEALAQAHEQLAQQTAELQRANADLEQFAAVAAHDLRNPLVAVGGLAELLNHRINDSDQQAGELATRISTAAQGGLDLIVDLLSYARLGTAAVTTQPVDLGELARTVAGDLLTALPEGTVDVATLPVVDGDPAQLRQLFTNLIGNALKFVPKGRVPHVQITAHLPEDEPGHIVVHVCDNGVGIPEQDRTRVFNVFTRGSSATTFTGTGIGLSICQRVVERHGGRIWIDQPPPTGGTRIAFSLPAVGGPESPER
jgi:PAS domain S-box-containing protein